MKETRKVFLRQRQRLRLYWSVQSWDCEKKLLCWVFLKEEREESHWAEQWGAGKVEIEEQQRVSTLEMKKVCWKEKEMAHCLEEQKDRMTQTR